MPEFQRITLPTVKAEQYLNGVLVRGMHEAVPYEIPNPYVITIQGVITFPKDGDWIIDEGDGVHFYPCAPEVFAKNYRLLKGGKAEWNVEQADAA